MPPIDRPAASKPKAPLAVISDAVQRLSEITEMVSALPDEYGAIFADLLRTTAESISPSPAADDEEEGESAVDRLAGFFRDHENGPATIAEMVEATGITYQTLRTFIYNRHRDKFAQVATLPGKPGRWRWAELLPESSDTSPPTPPPVVRPGPKRAPTPARPIGPGFPAKREPTQ